MVGTSGCYRGRVFTCHVYHIYHINELMNMRPALLTVLGFLLGLASAQATPVTPVTFTPSPSDLGDLDHHVLYTWRIDGVTVNPATITGATLTFTSIQNWDQNANVLHIHLLDTAKYSGVHSFVDDPTGAAPVVDFTDDFISTRFHSASNWLLAPGTSDTFLTDQSFTMTPVTWTYTFTAAQVAALRSDIANGSNFALGFDPDCHFFNNGVQMTMTTRGAATPDTGSTLVMFGTTAALMLSAATWSNRRKVKAVRA
jgi:hypothetical protein